MRPTIDYEQPRGHGSNERGTLLKALLIARPYVENHGPAWKEDLARIDSALDTITDAQEKGDREAQKTDAIMQRILAECDERIESLKNPTPNSDELPKSEREVLEIIRSLIHEWEHQ
jgi:hypothetical protein